MKGHFFILFFCIIAFSCASVKRSKTLNDIKFLESKFQDHVGFSLYDPELKKTLVAHNADKYFTPASNTKIFTLYASFKTLPDSLPALYYKESADSLIFWGTGDPSWLYSWLPSNSAIDFLQKTEKTLYFSASNFQDEHFGPGWSWDDYAYSFSVEKSSLPLYGNRLTINKESTSPFLKIEQSFFKPFFFLSDSINDESKVIRKPYGNHFFYYPNLISDSFETDVPFVTAPSLIANLLQDTLSKKVTVIDKSLNGDYKKYSGIPSDSAYQVMMQESDNFIAEQLLLICSGIISDTLNTTIAIDNIKRRYLKGMPDEPIWVDGSGLSRYNLFTPRSVVWLWQELLQDVGRQRLFPLLAIGGESGTLKNYYKADKPYIYGKTGTLSNNHSLSGFLLTKSGKVLIFSLMNNNYPDSSQPVKRYMERALRDIHLNY